MLVSSNGLFARSESPLWLSSPAAPHTHTPLWHCFLCRPDLDPWREGYNPIEDGAGTAVATWVSKGRADGQLATIDTLHEATSCSKGLQSMMKCSDAQAEVKDLPSSLRQVNGLGWERSGSHRQRKLLLSQWQPVTVLRAVGTSQIGSLFREPDRPCCNLWRLSRLSEQMESKVTLGRLENGSRKCSYGAVLMNDWLHRNMEQD